MFSSQSYSKFWLAVFASVGIAMAFVVALRERPVYEARAAIVLQDSVEPQLQWFESDGLIRKAAVKAGLAGDADDDDASLIEDARQRLKVTREAHSRLIRISVVSTDAAQAADLANGLIDAYADELDARKAGIAASMAQELKTVQSDLEESGSSMVTAADRVRHVALLHQYESLLRQAREHLSKATAPRNGMRADVPSEPVSANRWSRVAVGLPIGLIGGLVSLLGRRRLG